PPARKELAKHGISCDGKYAVQLKKSDYDKYDLFLVMDENNLFNICRIFPSDPKNKVHKLLEYAGRSDDVADPWYTGDFTVAYQDIYDGCTGLLNQIQKGNLP
ncbi:MAG: low molecular weight phosphotyrosine protein phosphatase, partial [Oscillospiraceae bacterium]|nr:low molecular weight phosphotyrosine protein phosphatase [Oscillospiraceae bacterium]